MTWLICQGSHGMPMVTRVRWSWALLGVPQLQKFFERMEMDENTEQASAVPVLAWSSVFFKTLGRKVKGSLYWLSKFRGFQLKGTNLYQDNFYSFSISKTSLALINTNKSQQWEIVSPILRATSPQSLLFFHFASEFNDRKVTAFLSSYCSFCGRWWKQSYTFMEVWAALQTPKAADLEGSFRDLGAEIDVQMAGWLVMHNTKPDGWC